MNKKLPNLYVNKIGKKIVNNEATFYSAKNKTNEVVDYIVSPDIGIKNVKKKISNMFNSANYVYKMNVTIVLKDGTIINKDVIGQVDNKLITIDEDLININDIRDIKF